MTEDYCEFCELPWSQCIHGNPPAPPPEPVKPAPRTTTTRSTAARAPRASRAATAAAPRRRTPPEDFEQHIVAVLEERGGEASADDVMDAIGVRMGDTFRSGDQEQGPTGELRWRTACRTARKHLATGGRLVAPKPGVWRLTD